MQKCFKFYRFARAERAISNMKIVPNFLVANPMGLVRSGSFPSGQCTATNDPRFGAIFCLLLGLRLLFFACQFAFRFALAHSTSLHCQAVPSSNGALSWQLQASVWGFLCVTVLFWKCSEMHFRSTTLCTESPALQLLRAGGGVDDDHFLFYCHFKFMQKWIVNICASDSAH